MFQYIDVNEERRSVDSGMVNDYIKEISGKHFTSKDFRTWSGSLAAKKAIIELGTAEGVTESKCKIYEVLDAAAKLLGNTRNVCRK